MIARLMKNKLGMLTVPVGAFLLSMALCYFSSPAKQAIGRQGANCTGFPSCSGDFDGQPNLTVTRFAVSLTPVNFHTTVAGATSSTAFAHTRVKIFTYYQYGKNPLDFARLFVSLPCDEKAKGVVCGTFNYTFTQVDCSKEELLKAALDVAPPPPPPPPNVVPDPTITVSFVGCKPLDWNILGDCSDKGFPTKLQGQLLLNRNGSGNSSNPKLPKCK